MMKERPSKVIEVKSRKNERGRFLIVDDEPTSSVILKSLLEVENHRVECATSEDELKIFMSKYSFDAVFLDYKLGNTDGLDVLSFLIREYPYCKVVIITAHGSIDLAVKAIAKGASGFITKPFDEQKVAEEASKVLQRPIRLSRVSGYSDAETGLIGVSPALARIHEQIHKMKDVESTVLVFGESGTGKELVARSLHNLSKRSSGRFEAINCGAIPENLLESELFGSRRGAYTDAKKDRKGLFEICNNGTLFLDEIGELPLHLQVKLLRVLQEREVTPLGSNTSIKVNTRIVAATNKNLDRLVHEGSFRKDLFYRLSVLQIQIPPLREREEDITEISNYLVEKTSKRLEKKIKPLTLEIITRLTGYDWPGNVRELQNALERAIVLSDDGVLNVKDIFSHIDIREHDSSLPMDNFHSLKKLSEAKDDFEKSYLEKLLKATRGNVSQASKAAGRIRTDMYRLFNKYNIDPAKFKPWN